MAIAQENLKVKGMSCGHCKSAVEEALGKLKGVEQAVVNLEAKSVTITYQPAIINRRQIINTITEEGYEVVE
ncbi:copper ion binding protein [Desulfofalx alkaliphila]|uniref:copper ion binding protein n=1 Tax=Desulfofalx alkaliphila TaxID=105483 RepID=UPI000A7B1F69